LNEIRLSGLGRRGRALLSVAMPMGGPNLGALFAGALVLWFSWPTLLSLHASFTESADYSHGYLLFAVTALLIVRELRRQPLARASGSAAGTALLVLTSVAVIVGHASTTVVLAQIALPLLWLSAIWAFAGARNARRFVLPLSYLFLAIPVWNLLVEPLRRLTIFVVTSWTRAAGLPAFIEGNLIHVPTGTFEVQGGCAGLRYALVALALALFACLMQRRRFGQTVLLTSVALTLALVGNWLRVFITVAAGLAPEGQIAMLVHNQHTLVGWVIFAVFMVPLFYLDQKLPPGSAPISAASGVERPAAAPSAGASAYVACAALALAIWLNYRISEDEIAGPVHTLTIPAPAITDWNRSADWQDARRPVFIEPSGEFASWYAKGDVRIGAYVANYAAQGQGREVVFAHNLPAGRTGFVSSRHRVGEAASGLAFPFQELAVSDAEDRRRLVWVGFRIAGRPAANALEAKALQVAGVLRGRRDAQAVVLTASCDGDCEKARRALSDFAAAAAEPLYAQAARSFEIEAQ
jgi:EpsI family protein